MGYIAENRDIRAALIERAAAAPRLEMVCPGRVRDFVTSSRGIEVQLEGTRTLSAPVLVVAEGRDSPSRERAGIGIVSWSYPQRGIVATVQHERPHNGTAYEHFLPSGPFAILPMTGNRSSLVWTEREASADPLLRLPQA